MHITLLNMATEWITLENSNCGGIPVLSMCRDSHIEVGVEVDDSVNQHAEGMIVFECEVDQLVVHNAIGNCKV